MPLDLDRGPWLRGRSSCCVAAPQILACLSFISPPDGVYDETQPRGPTMFVTHCESVTTNDNRQVIRVHLGEVDPVAEVFGEATFEAVLAGTDFRTGLVPVGLVLLASRRADTGEAIKLTHDELVMVAQAAAAEFVEKQDLLDKEVLEGLGWDEEDDLGGL